MAINEWKKFLIPYEKSVNELKIKIKSIRYEYRKKGEYSPIEFVTGRVKEISSIIEKAKKLNITMDNIEVMEDIAGIRIMCQFVEDINEVVSLIKNRSDMEVIYEKDYITNYKPSGYRSYHMIIKYTVNMIDGPKEILAEFQIRTLAMNFWATIEHSLNYKYKENIPEYIKEKLKSSADAAHKLDTEMMEIRKEIMDAQKLFEVKSDYITSILDRIWVLYYNGEVKLSKEYEHRLDIASESSGVRELAKLYEEIDPIVEKIRREKQI